MVAAKDRARYRGPVQEIGTRRAVEGVGLHQFVWALMLTRDHLWHFLQQEAFADNIVALHGELELHRMLIQFFDRAVYYGIVGYEEVRQHNSPNSDLAKAEELAVSIDPMSGRKTKFRMWGPDQLPSCPVEGLGSPSIFPQASNPGRWSGNVTDRSLQVGRMPGSRQHLSRLISPVDPFHSGPLGPGVVVFFVELT
jgi:hypothetical protein